jgi:hypothetical protein
MLALGASKPWPEALKAISGEDRLDGGALLDYFAPLKAWLDEQNRMLAPRPEADAGNHREVASIKVLLGNPEASSGHGARM